MSGLSSIEWCDATWNPVRGCTRVSDGCRHCYAETLAARNLPAHRSPTTGEPFATRTPSGPRWTGKVELIPHLLDWPLRRRKPLRIFVNSMSDLFHEALQFDAIAAVFGAMALAHQHTFLVLTKRPDRMVEFFRWIEGEPLFLGKTAKTSKRMATGPAHACLVCLSAHGPEEINSPPFTAHVLAGCASIPEGAPIRRNWPLPNVWLGVSVEDPEHLGRLDKLRACPAAARFVSFEPLLEDLGRLDLRGIDQAIIGGESGPGARPCNLSWIRSIRDQCRDQTIGAPPVACFVKQLGARPVRTLPKNAAGWSSFPVTFIRDRKGGDPSEWPEDLRVREIPSAGAHQ